MQRLPLSVVSLNIQHGWNMNFSSVPMLGRRTVLTNLDKIADLLQREKTDVVLLQEVDRISPLTFTIDQLSYLAKKMDMPFAVHGASSEVRIGTTVMYSAGCGIISRFPIVATEHVRFEPCLPTPRKGFLAARIALADGKEITVVSAHLVPLDILNGRAKRTHIEHMARALRGRRPLVIGGDLNSSLSGLGRSSVNALATRLNVRTHKNAMKPLTATYPARNPRRKIDWIFVSPEVRITDYRILSERVSDHLAIRTTLAV